MSSGPVEQLYYTWARRGFGVGEGEQIVAASPGLRDVGSPLTQDLMALCRPPVGELSFGWVVRAGHVAIFRRVPAGRDVHGRLGRFFAHVLAAPWGLLTSDDLVDLQSNSLWMEDAPDGVDPNLPTLTLPSLRRRAPVTIDAELHAAVAGALLALESGDPLVLDRDLASSVSLAHRLNALLAPRSRPERGWLGFSTAEPGSRVPLFNLVGRVEERNDRLQASNALPDAHLRLRLRCWPIQKSSRCCGNAARPEVRWPGARWRSARSAPEQLLMPRLCATWRPRAITCGQR